MVEIFCLVALLFLAAAAGVFWFRRACGQPMVLRVTYLCLPLTILMIVTVILNSILDDMVAAWSGARILPLFALRFGYRMYYPIAEGPIIVTIYSPLSALAYFPALLFRMPSHIIIAGSVLATLWWLGPTAWIVRRMVGPDRRATGGWLAVAALFVLVAFNLRPLRDSMFSLHADAPAMGLAALAIAALIYWEGPSSLVWSSALVVLAVGTKQVLAPLPLLLCLYVMLSRGMGGLARYLAYLAAFTAAFVALCGVSFGLREMYFNMWTIPGKQPWTIPFCDTCPPEYSMSGKIAVLVKFLRAQTRILLTEMFWIPVSYLVLMATAAAVQGRLSAGAWLRAHPWSLWAAASLMHVPTGIIGHIKVGGYPNNFCYMAYFALLGLVSLALTVIRIPELPAPSRAGILTGGLAMSVALTLSLLPLYVELPGKARGAAAVNPADTAYRYALAHPGRAYFPWHPLSHLMAEGQLYHFDYGAVDRKLAGFPPTKEHWAAHIPKDVDQVIVRKPYDPDVLEYMPDFKVKRSIPELPGWDVWERGASQ